uniref:RING-type domain-containing protein n=1 Tax=Strix occidentalis caurina TaxID=311401 RepID=A0A8D0FY43_STROC
MATVTHGDKPIKRIAGLKPCVSATWEVRGGQGRDGACGGLLREEGGATPWGTGAALRADPRPASPSESAEKHLGETPQCCWDRDAPNARCGRAPCLRGKRTRPLTRWSRVSKVSLLQHSRGAVGAVSVGLSTVAEGGSACNAPSSPQPPALALSPSGTEQAPGDNPSGTFPPAPQRCSFPLAFALSPPVCMLCGRAQADPDLCGEKIEKEVLCAHLICLVSAPGLPPKCFVCGKNGAAITCCREDCDRSFHLPCAMEGECVTQYFSSHRSFCREHHPEQEVEAAPEKNTECLICLEPVEDRKSYHTMVCPACKHAWFHRGCIQVGAAPSALYTGFSFNCPVCRDKHDFILDMLTMGIRIPLRLVSCLRHNRCDARECLCPGGREQAEEEGPWELLLCSSCAAEGTHRRCSNLRTSRTSWECENCAGQGIGKRQSTFMPLGWGQGPGKAWQEVPRLRLAEPLCSRRAVATSLASPQWLLFP